MVQITLSHSHYAYVSPSAGAPFSQRRAVKAADVRKGDLLWAVGSDGLLPPEAIVDVVSVIEEGLVIPFTMCGVPPLLRASSLRNRTGIASTVLHAQALSACTISTSMRHARLPFAWKRQGDKAARVVAWLAQSVYAHVWDLSPSFTLCISPVRVSATTVLPAKHIAFISPHDAVQTYLVRFKYLQRTGTK